MSDLNLSWLKKNFSNTPCIIFDIGCADLYDSIRFKKILPLAEIFSFEPNPIHRDSNIRLARKHKINFYDIAFSDSNGQANFYPGDPDRTEHAAYCGTLEYRDDSCNLKTPISVTAMTFDYFCEQYDVRPDFCHVDAEGVESKIFKMLNEKIKPKAVWSENWNSGSINELDRVMIDHGYTIEYKNSMDTLYVHQMAELTPYVALPIKNI